MYFRNPSTHITKTSCCYGCTSHIRVRGAYAGSLMADPLCFVTVWPHAHVHMFQHVFCKERTGAENRLINMSRPVSRSFNKRSCFHNLTGNDEAQRKKYSTYYSSAFLANPKKMVICTYLKFEEKIL